jgi:hypothetical protein
MQDLSFAADLHIPLFTMLQLVVFLGWMMVAEGLIHTFGDDDDDFDLLGLMEMHVMVR